MKRNLLILVTAIMFVLAGCGSKPTLSEWVNGDDVAEAESTANEQYASSGMVVDIYAEGEDILVYSIAYQKDVTAPGTSFTWGEVLDSMEQSAIDEYFNGQISTLEDGMSGLFDACKSDLGIDLKAVRVEYTLEGKTLWSYDITK